VITFAGQAAGAVHLDKFRIRELDEARNITGCVGRAVFGSELANPLCLRVGALNLSRDFDGRYCERDATRHSSHEV